MKRHSLIFLSLIIFPISSTFGQIAVSDHLYDPSKPEDLGLPLAKDTETVTIFSPSDSTDKFSNNVVMTAFKGQLYCQWQSAAKDEDGPNSWVAYSRSSDGKHWSAPMKLAESIPNGYCSSGGWWVDGDTLIAYINTWPDHITPRGGYTRFTYSTDGKNWSSPEVVRMHDGDTLKGIIEQDPHALPSGRMINAAHFQPGLRINPIFTDDPKGLTGWKQAEFTNLTSGDVSQAIEPSTFLNSDEEIIMIFRDQESSFVKLASMSTDQGETWTKPAFTNIPDARTKQSAGNLTNGTAYLVGNPVKNKIRIPLVVSLSENGHAFNKAFVLRKGGNNLQPLRYEGKAKRLGYHYPKSMVFNGYLYVSYATNKEDVEFTRVPLESLK